MRIVEAYIGEYASGKSEVAVNRAVFLAREKRKITIVDLDLVEPCYTLRRLKKLLNEQGIEVIAWETEELLGLGETGALLHPSMRWALQKSGDIILDIGYGVYGAKVLNLLEGAASDPDLRIYAVINLGRSMTSTKEEVLEYLRTLGRVDGLINNSHLGEQTSKNFLEQASEIMEEVSEIVAIPIIATTVTEEMAAYLSKSYTHPIWPLQRYMHNSFW